MEMYEMLWAPLCHRCQERRAELWMLRPQGSLKCEVPLFTESFKIKSMFDKKMPRNITLREERREKIWLLECEILHH